jgi:carbamoyltransferase
MLLVAPVRDEIRTPPGNGYDQAFGIEKLNYRRSTIPAITHVDYSARVQTVDEARNPDFHKLLTKFYEKTGCAVLINTSFNVRGEPIVCTPSDAYRCFQGTEMDVLVVGRKILLREKQPQLDESARGKYLDQFKLD